MNSWKCGNCGHEHEITDNAESLEFQWVTANITKVTCAGCGSYSLQQVTAVDMQARPVAGQFLQVRSHIKRGRG